MRIGAMGLGGIVAVVGIVLLVVSLTMVPAVSLETGGVDEAMGNVNKTLTDAADALDNTGEDLATIDGNLGDIEGTLSDSLDEAVTTLEGVDLKGFDSGLSEAEDVIVGTMDDAGKLLQDTNGGLGEVNTVIIDANTMVTDVDEEVESLLKDYRGLHLPAQSFDDVAIWLEENGYESFGGGVADYLEKTDGAINLWPLELTAGELDALADEMEAVNLQSDWVRDWADYLESKNAVIALSTSDVTAQFGPLEERLENTSKSLKDIQADLESIQANLKDGEETAVSMLSDADSTLSDVDSFLGETTTNVKSLKDNGVTTISNLHDFLGSTEAELSTVAGDLRTVSENIESVDVGGQINSTVDWLNGIISSLKLYMIISSIMFILAGAGIILAALYAGKQES